MIKNIFGFSEIFYKNSKKKLEKLET